MHENAIKVYRRKERLEFDAIDWHYRSLKERLPPDHPEYKRLLAMQKSAREDIEHRKARAAFWVARAKHHDQFFRVCDYAARHPWIYVPPEPEEPSWPD